MSEKLLRVFSCDVCGVEYKQDELTAAHIPMWHYCSDEDGATCNPYIRMEKVDLCDDCLHRHTLVKRGFRCVEKYAPCPHDAIVVCHNARTNLSVGGVKVENK